MVIMSDRSGTGNGEVGAQNGSASTGPELVPSASRRSLRAGFIPSGSDVSAMWAGLARLWGHVWPAVPGSDAENLKCS